MCGTSSLLTHTVANSPTICLHATRQYLSRRLAIAAVGLFFTSSEPRKLSPLAIMDASSTTTSSSSSDVVASPSTSRAFRLLQPIRHGVLYGLRRRWSTGQVHDLSRRPRVMAARRTSRWEDEDLWNSDGSRGLELGVARADERGDAMVAANDRLTGEASEKAEASGDGDGRFSAWLMSASHRTAGSLSSITRTLPALRGTTSWNLHRNNGGKSFPSY